MKIAVCFRWRISARRTRSRPDTEKDGVLGGDRTRRERAGKEMKGLTGGGRGGLGRDGEEARNLVDGVGKKGERRREGRG